MPPWIEKRTRYDAPRVSLHVRCTLPQFTIDHLIGPLACRTPNIQDAHFAPNLDPNHSFFTCTRIQSVHILTLQQSATKKLEGASEQAGALTLGRGVATEIDPQGGKNDFDSASPALLPILGRGILRERGLTSPAKGADQGDEDKRGSLGHEYQPVPDNTTTTC